jgi:hypothetical protein
MMTFLFDTDSHSYYWDYDISLAVERKAPINRLGLFHCEYSLPGLPQASQKSNNDIDNYPLDRYYKTSEIQKRLLW